MRADRPALADRNRIRPLGRQPAYAAPHRQTRPNPNKWKALIIIEWSCERATRLDCAIKCCWRRKAVCLSPPPSHSPCFSLPNGSTKVLNGAPVALGEPAEQDNNNSLMIRRRRPWANESTVAGRPQPTTTGRPARRRRLSRRSKPRRTDTTQARRPAIISDSSPLVIRRRQAHYKEGQIARIHYDWALYSVGNASWEASFSFIASAESPH